MKRMGRIGGIGGMGSMEIKDRIIEAIGECERFIRRARPLSELPENIDEGAALGDAWRDIERAAMDAQRALLRMRNSQ